MRYLRRPVEVEARQLTADADWDEIARWCDGAVQEVLDSTAPPYRRRVVAFLDPSNRFRIWAGAGDWIVEEDGRFSRVNQAEFDKLYDVPEQTPRQPGEPT